MFIVVNKIKNGNKVIYEVQSENGGKIEQLTKDELVVEIENNRISNAKIQNYKGQIIIRVKGDKKTTSKQTSKQTPKQTQQRKNILAIEIFKNVAKCFGIQAIEEALAIGFDKYELDEEIDILDRKRIIELSYRMAVDIKEIADKQNNRLVDYYKKAFENSV